VREIVAEHYRQNSSPLLLANLGLRLRNQNLWPSEQADGKPQSLRQLIEAAHDPDLCIVRDRSAPAYIAVTTAAAKPMMERYIERRSQTKAAIPDLEALPLSVLLAFCVQAEPGERVFLHRSPPFKYQILSADDAAPTEYVEVDQRYRRPGLKVSPVSELSASDRLDLQTKIAAWSRDKNIPVEGLYRDAVNKNSNALERLLAAQRPGLAAKIVIPGDIALLLSRQE